MSGDLLVRGGTFVDGTGAPARRADVRVRDGVVAEVAESLRPDGEAEIDAGGAVVAPGFVDVHTHYDPSVWWDPDVDPMPAHGVTTVVTGNCSLSLAPLRAEQRASFADVFSFIEDIPVEAFHEAIPWSWDDWPGYRDALAGLALAVNVAPLVGHSALRLFVLGDRADDPADADGIARMARELDRCVAAGAFGLSTSFGDQDRTGRPVPSRAADDAELAALVQVLDRTGRVLEFVPFFADYGHQQFRDDIDRVARLTAGTGVVSTYAPLFSRAAEPELADALVAQAARAQAAGARLYPQVSPRPVELVVNFGSTMMFMALPAWNEAANAPDPRRRGELLADRRWRDRARAEWDAARFSEGVGAAMTITAARPADAGFVGRPVSDVAAARGCHPSDALAQWALDHDARPGLAVTVGNDDDDVVAALLRHPSTVVGASDAGAHLQMQSGAGDSTLLLTKHVRDRGDLTLEQAVHRLTAQAAWLVGVADRGVVEPGRAGDLVVFALDELKYGPAEEVRDVPPDGGPRLTRPPAGVRATVVGGVVVAGPDGATGPRPGHILDAASGRGRRR